MSKFQPGDVVIANNLSNEHYTLTNQRTAFVGIVLGYRSSGHILVFSLSSDLHTEKDTFYNQMPRSAYFHLKQAITLLSQRQTYSYLRGHTLVDLRSLFKGIPQTEGLFNEKESVSLYPVIEDCFTLVPKQSSRAMLRSHLRGSFRLVEDLSMQLDAYHSGSITTQGPKIFL